ARAYPKNIITSLLYNYVNPKHNYQLENHRATPNLKPLVAAGVAAERIELRKLAETEGDGSDREARRVEVSVE
ncbi:MAG: hypothetical protein O9972_50515, partial [Burkholderiales bacterium]|nr:hypothetical protein [Burkholderiales bacterium]